MTPQRFALRYGIGCFVSPVPSDAMMKSLGIRVHRVRFDVGGQRRVLRVHAAVDKRYLAERRRRRQRERRESRSAPQRSRRPPGAMGKSWSGLVFAFFALEQPRVRFSRS